MFALPAVVGLSPFEHPDARLVAALARAGAFGVLDLGHDQDVGREALRMLARRVPEGFGVRIPEHVDPTTLDLPPAARVVVVPASLGQFRFGDRTVLAQVTSIAEARAALAGGAHGLIVKGHEAGGCVGEETAFVLLQRVLGELGPSVPVWVQGGIGLHTAAACIAAGARGVVLDAQLALLAEASTSEAMKRALHAFDGSETTLVHGYRLYTRPNARAAAPADTAADIARQLGARDPAQHLVTLGQDAAFARPLAERYATVERVVRAVYTAIQGHLRQARALRPLARRSPLAVELGIECPIAQGPMTRVSDRPAFAEAVARGGGLPFLALSLMRGAEARALLEDARGRLGDKGWGVGILGFLPPEQREEQLAAIRAVRPPIALIAGGRPAQAKPLEDVGIATFLHVPSPGLLDLFLKEGARRFVFEGRECGGHVGPRSSFVLWETAIERLLACDDVRNVSVLFAGGIHDALSARMVAALAAPLAARGAKIGVLMGTAYLFTDEAVACGAITRAFQDVAIGCDHTILLETAPGHATRCAESPYVDAFERERLRLAAEGSDAQTTWAALEQLNVGRLRVAAKGLKREGDRLVDVDDDEQRLEGMFMIGQVASLRAKRCTIAELHAEVTDEAAAALARIEAPTAPVGAGSRASVDVAIVGMACIFPDAPDLATFWSNVVLGRNAVREVPRERWDAALHYDPTGTGEKTPSKWGGFLPPTVFDPGAYGIPPRSLAAIDPVQLLSLEVAKRALDDAGYGAARPFDRERTSVVFGAEAGTDLANAYGFRATWGQYVAGDLPEPLDAALPSLTEDSFPGVLANVIAGRIANRLDLGGLNYTVDAACASSLAAVDVACKELAGGTSEMVIAGGADLHNGLHDYLMFASVHALSPTGQCRTFDANADGIVLGEGVAAIVLKRLEDAERDGDRVYAVIKGVGGSSDGKSLGLTAPRKEGQLRALERAYANAGVSPSSVALVEAHGTGTVVGDRTELATLTEFFGDAGALASTCTLGSVKSQIGHTKCAAGLAGMIKAALAIHRGVLPPTRNVTTPNGAYDAGSSPFVLRDAASPWVTGERVAGVSAFGFGGTNFHAVLAAHEEAEPARAGLEAWPAEIVVVRGADRADALPTIARLEAIAASEAPPALRDLARSAARAGGGAKVQVAIVATDLADLRAKLAAVREGRSMAGIYEGTDAPARNGRDVAILFPGQGSQRPGMLAELFIAFPELRDLLRLGSAWSDRLFPGTAFSPEQRGAQLRAISDTTAAQPTLGIVDLAVSRILGRLGLRAAAMGGHSYGELVALAAAGAFDAETLLALSEARARCILAAANGAPGTMAAVRAPIDRVREVLADVGVTLANHNAPDQVVIAGSNEDVALACERLASAGISARSIPVACAFHSPIVGGARETFGMHVSAAEMRAPEVPVYGNAAAAPYSSDVDDVRRTLADQLARPVRFVEQIEAMYAAGARVFVEAGPGSVLSDLTSRILRGRPHTVVACDGGDSRGALFGLVNAAAKLVAAGVELDLEPLFEARAEKPFDLLAAPAFTSPATAWVVDGFRARPLRGELPDFAMRPLDAPVVLSATAPAEVAAAPTERDQVVRDYLRTMRELVDGQRQVMLRYLGETAPAPARAETLDAVAPSPAAAARPVRTVEAPAPSSAPDKPEATPLELLIATISERTGYPPDMLDPNLDLEADLGIDSIKRIEILGAIRDRLGLRLPAADESSTLLEELATVKTLKVLAERLDAHVAANAPPAGHETIPPAADPPPAPDSAPPPSATNGVGRYVMELESVPPAKPNGVTVAGRDFAITRDGIGVAMHLAEILAHNGARVRVLDPGEPLGKVDGLVHLQTLAADSPEAVRALFTRAKEAAIVHAKWIVAATSLGGSFGHAGSAGPSPSGSGGVAGLLKSLAKEIPAARVRLVDLHAEEDPRQLAAQLYGELLADDRHLEVGYSSGSRSTLSVRSRPSTIPPPRPMTIDEKSVVLVTGGARGITATVALAMARRFRCTFELIGRSPMSTETEDAELRAATDLSSIRRVLAARANGAGRVSPAAIDAEGKRILATREIRETLEGMRAAGARADYHTVDVRDDAALGVVVDTLVARHGKIDGIIHGAGLIEDKLLGDKTAESFDRVFDTKVNGAYTLARKLAHDARFFVLFSSISGAFGNRGQTDYAAANDALDKLAHHLHRLGRARVLSINWGPWRGVGMVRPELELEYARRGIDLIAPDDGVQRFLDELMNGSEPQVILSAAAPEALS